MIKGIFLDCTFQMKPIIFKCPSWLEMTEARVKWMNSQSLKEKEKQGATVTFLKIAMALQEGPTSPSSLMSSSPLHNNKDIGTLL